MQINFAKPSFSTINRSNNLNNSKLSFGKSPYFPEQKIVEQSGYYYIELPSGQLSCIGQYIPKEKSLDTKLNEVLRNSKTPDKLRKFYDKIYAAAVKGHKELQNITEETHIVNIIQGINDSTMLQDIKTMFEIAVNGNNNNNHMNGCMAGALCSENSRLGTIVNVLKKIKI